MRILAIDPGPEKSAIVVIENGKPISELCGIEENEMVRRRILTGGMCINAVAIEMIASYGMAVGASVFDTCVWVGRFTEMFVQNWWLVPSFVFRRDVKLHLCGSPKAKDPNVRQALLDRFGSTREKAIGTKRAPGPLYGFKADMWAALAVAVTYEENAA